jgi:hypothetical protein
MPDSVASLLTSFGWDIVSRRSSAVLEYNANARGKGDR